MRLLSDFVKTIPSPVRFDFLPEGNYAKASNEGFFPRSIWVKGSSPPHLKGELSVNATVEPPASPATAATEQGMPCEKGSATGPTTTDVAEEDERS